LMINYKYRRHHIENGAQPFESYSF
jgi:hypothetical protein